MLGWAAYKANANKPRQRLPRPRHQRAEAHTNGIHSTGATLMHTSANGVGLTVACVRSFCSRPDGACVLRGCVFASANPGSEIPKG